MSIPQKIVRQTKRAWRSDAAGKLIALLFVSFIFLTIYSLDQRRDLNRTTKIVEQQMVIGGACNDLKETAEGCARAFERIVLNGATPEQLTKFREQLRITAVQGERGAPGRQGERGPAGRDGADGRDGARGATGARGAAGPRGAAGATGERGAPGVSNVPGPRGPQGPAGPQGPPGRPSLIPGPQGPPGISPNVAAIVQQVLARLGL